MYKDKTILGLIPARGGSKGLPRKNILPLFGKPVIGWTIEQALASRCLNRVVVSTDDEEIAEISKKYGAEVPFMRPKKFATDEAKTIDVIFHTLDFFNKSGIKFDYLAVLEPTSPLRDKSDIDKSIKLLINKEDGADSLISVGEISLEHPFIAKSIGKNGFVGPFIEMETPVVRRQDLPKAYFPYGVIYLSKVSKLEEFKTFYQPRILPYFIKRWQNYEIDDIWDVLCVEAIFKEIMVSK